ncbi:MAG TPA: hypothetical protein DHV29_11820 [Bacteroidales bacterium]|nr:MAG: hypothetical protein A2W94_09890 [Bacteroidetes bacterium GWE2_42_42]HCY24163.1 hypothetical protein [Bacteroidales bacterium]
MAVVSASSFAQNVGISSTAIVPDASSMLEIRSTNKGLLIPRVALSATSSASPVTAPALSLLVFNTASAGDVTPGYYYWDGSKWVRMLSGSMCLTLQQAYDGCSGSGSGRNIIISGTNSVNLSDANASSIGFKSTHSNNGVAVSADNTSTSVQYATIQATTNSNYGTVGSVTPPTSAVMGNSSGLAYGVSGQIAATGSAQSAIYGNNLRTTGGHGVYGIGFNGTVGESNYQAGYGVFGRNYGTATTSNAVGTYGRGYMGVWGETVDGQGAGVFGQNASSGTTYKNVGVWGLGWVGVYGVSNNLGSAGYGLYSVGMFAATGAKSFEIDYPFDPGNKILRHFSMESPEVLNLYRGNVELDSHGEIEVQLPDYFEAININFSYQLTPIGAPASGLYIKQEIIDGSFIIAGGNAGQKVSWVVYAERNDKYIQTYPEVKNVIVQKKVPDTYLMPELWGQPKSKSVFTGPKTEPGQMLTPDSKLIQSELPILKSGENDSIENNE